MSKLLDTFSYIVDGEPPRKNSRYKISAVSGHARMRNSKEFNSFVDVLTERRRLYGYDTIADGCWRCTVQAHWSRKTNRNGCAGEGVGDVDAPVSSVLDALQAAGIIDNDVRITELYATKHYSHNIHPYIYIELRRIK